MCYLYELLRHWLRALWNACLIFFTNNKYKNRRFDWKFVIISGYCWGEVHNNIVDFVDIVGADRHLKKIIHVNEFCIVVFISANDITHWFLPIHFRIDIFYQHNKTAMRDPNRETRHGLMAVNNIPRNYICFYFTHEPLSSHSC